MQKSLELAGQSTSEEVAGQEGCQTFILGVPLASWPTQDKAPLGLSENTFDGNEI